jgi:hypothetical protein
MRILDKVTAMAAAAALMLVCGFASDPAQAPGADIIVTSAPVYQPVGALRGEERFPQGAQLLRVHAGKSEPLVTGFAATADANVSFDAKTVLFAGKQAASDPWQIWELNIADRSVRKVSASASDAIRPFYLPFGRFVYAQRTTQGFQLEVAGKATATALAPIDTNAGSTVLQISYLPTSAVPVDVLLDGRILFEANFPLGLGSTPDLYLVYTDGSGVESYRCDHGTGGPVGRWGGRQLASGDVVFTHGASISRFTSPLAKEDAIAAPNAEYAGDIAETASGAWLLSARTTTGAHYELNIWKPGANVLQSLLADNGKDIVEPALVAPRTRPKRHPSGLHDWNYANLLALDARQSRRSELAVTPKTVQLEELDVNGKTVVLGRARVEADGSFFVSVPADKPIHFALLDENGGVLRQEHGWFWVRRGEQRICVGCHTGPERSAANSAPAVLLRSTVPTNLSAVFVADNAQGEN